MLTLIMGTTGLVSRIPLSEGFDLPRRGNDEASVHTWERCIGEKYDRVLSVLYAR